MSNICILLLVGWNLISFLYGLPQSDFDSGPLITYRVKENTSKGTVVGNIHKDISVSPSDSVTYVISEATYFDISSTGDIIVNGDLDRDNDRKLCSPDFLKECTWVGLALPVGEGRVISLKIIIDDLNDNTPSWSVEPIISIPENSPQDTSADFPLAVDRDSDVRTISHYSIQPPSTFFEIINQRSGNVVVPKLIVRGKLDREKQAWHNLTVIAVDGGDPPLTGRTRVKVKVTDENDCTPRFNSTIYSVEIDEDETPGTQLPLYILAVDCDEANTPFSKISYKFSLSTQERVSRDFRIDSKTGAIYVANKLDYDPGHNSYEFQIVAEDGGTPSKSSEATVRLSVRDRNNNAPEIKVNKINLGNKSVSIHEGLQAGQVVASLTVRDRDTGVNGEFNCMLSPYQKDFQIIHTGTVERMSVYELHSARVFDREHRSIIPIQIVCRDLGEPPQTGSLDILVKVLDVNDNNPQFTKATYKVQVSEGNDPGTKIFRVEAFDRDEGANGKVTYKMNWPSLQGPNPFKITDKGNIIAVDTLDREKNPNGFRFSVIATDGGVPSRNDTCSVYVELIDMNDCTPKFHKESYSFEITEDYGRNFSGPKNVGSVLATDCDLNDNALVSYSIIPPGSLFQIDDRGNIQTTRIIDREKQSSYLIQVVATDSPKDPATPSRTSTVSLTVKVKDLNDNKPVFLYPNVTSRQIRVSFREKTGYVIARLRAIDSDEKENARISYTLIGGNLYKSFNLNKYTGDLMVGEKMKAIHKGTISLTVQARDHGHPALSQTANLNILVDDSPPIGFSHSEPTEGEGMETNQLIIICIVIATGIICAVLITAISIMARKAPCFHGSRQSPEIDSPNKCLNGPTLYTAAAQDLDLLNGTGSAGRSSSLLTSNGYTLSDYRIQQMQSSNNSQHLETFVTPAQNKLEDNTLDSDGDSGRGGSENNVKLGHPHSLASHYIQPGHHHRIPYGSVTGSLYPPQSCVPPYSTSYPAMFINSATLCSTSAMQSSITQARNSSPSPSPVSSEQQLSVDTSATAEQTPLVWKTRVSRGSESPNQGGITMTSSSSTAPFIARSSPFIVTSSGCSPLNSTQTVLGRSSRLTVHTPVIYEGNTTSLV